MKMNLLFLALLSFFALNINAQKKLAVGTQITMGDDSRKSIDQIVVGDVLLTYNYTDKIYEKKKITSIDHAMYNRMARLVLENKMQILTTSDYPFLGEKNWRSIDPEKTKESSKYANVKNATMGDYIYFYDVLSTSSDRIAFIEGITEPIKAYSIQIEGDNAIIANGFIVGADQ